MSEIKRPPSERAGERLLRLIQNTESAAVEMIAFDPWAVAANDDLLSSIKDTPDPEKSPVYIAWVRHYRLKVDAQKVWNGPILRSPFEQVYAATVCLHVKARIESGDGFAVMEAVAKCATHGLVMPAWLSVAFVERYQRVVSGASKGWGEADAFGSAIPKGKNLAGLVATSKFEYWAYEVATDLLCALPDRPIDVGFYEEIGEAIDRKSTQVQSLVKQFCKDGFHPPLKYIKGGLLSGFPLDLIFSNWENERHDRALSAMGYEICDDGIFRRVDLENS